MGGPISTPLPALRLPRSLAEDAADVLRTQILAGGLPRGAHLVEARIARQFNVSRGPVREAFKLLRAEGLVEEEPRRGTFVVTLSSVDVREIYDLRAALEGPGGTLDRPPARPGHHRRAPRDARRDRRGRGLGRRPRSRPARPRVP